MTVAELINKLKEMPQDMMVVIPGYEGGYDNPELKFDSMILDANWNGTNKNHWYNGRHDQHYEMDDEPKNNPVKCVVVGRGI